MNKTKTKALESIWLYSTQEPIPGILYEVHR
jgi:hypothetical protein